VQKTFIKNMSNEAKSNSGLRAFSAWLTDVGISESTGARWRRDGVVKTVNITGRVYISEAEIKRFTDRAEAGEFAKRHYSPFSKADAQLIPA